MKKSTITFALGLLLIIACRAQQPVAKVDMANIKVKTTAYKLNRPNNKVVTIVNNSNKLRGVDGIAPNVPKGIIMKKFMIYDRSIIPSICADIIPLQVLKESPKGYNEYLYIRLKISTTGQPLEMEFLIHNNSLLTADQIQHIEAEIFKSQFKVTYKPEVQKFLPGANYFEIDVIISYDDLLKIKESNKKS